MPEKLLNLAQAAEFLNLTPKYLYQLLGEGKLGCYGGRHERKRFSMKHLNDYLRSIETKPFKESKKYEFAPDDYRTEINLDEMFNF